MATMNARLTVISKSLFSWGTILAKKKRTLQLSLYAKYDDVEIISVWESISILLSGSLMRGNV